MNIVVIGGTGLIGSRVLRHLTELGHQVVAASPSTGVDTVTGLGLDRALDGAQVVIDVSNSPSLDGSAVEFFEASTRNLLAAEKKAGVQHHVALSVVNTDALARKIDYFTAKVQQENRIAAADTPFSIVRATQFFEFVRALTDASTDGPTVRLPHILIRPIAAADVAEALAIAAVNDPLSRTIDIAGPRVYGLDDLVRTALTARGDHRTVITDPSAGYWGAQLDDDALVPQGEAVLFDTLFEEWLLETAATGD